MPRIFLILLTLVATGCVEVLPGAPYEYEEFYHTDQMMELARPAAGLLESLEKGEKDELHDLVKSYAERDGLEVDTLFLAARLAWLVEDTDLARTFVKRAAGRFGQVRHPLSEIPVDVICRFWLLSLAYQQSDEGGVQAAAADVRELVAVDASADWADAVCVELAAYLPEASAEACQTDAHCDPTEHGNIPCLYAQLNAASQAYEHGDGPAWCQGLPFLQEGSEDAFQAARIGMSYMAAIDLDLAGVGNSITSYDDPERLRTLHSIQIACCKKALRARLPRGTRDAAQLTLGAILGDLGPESATSAPFRELVTADSYYAPYVAILLIGLERGGIAETGWDYERLREAYPWLRAYVPEPGT